MRAGRLIALVLILQREGRATAAELSKQLEVSERTVIRDIEALSGAGVPIYATRGPGGGYQLLEGYTPRLPDSAGWEPRSRRGSQQRRGMVWIAPEALGFAASTGRLPPLRVLRSVPPDERGWLRARFRLSSVEAAALELLVLGPRVEVLEPPELRQRVADLARQTADLYDVSPPTAAVGQHPQRVASAGQLHPPDRLGNAGRQRVVLNSQ